MLKDPNQSGLRAAALACAIAALMPAAAALAQADQSYPARPIRILVGFQPGGGSDIMARAAGQKLAERWNSPVVTDNRPGAGGTIAMDIAHKAAADGYTLLVISGSAITNATLVTRVPYDIRAAFYPITQLTSQPYVLLAHPSVPAKTVRELIAHARANPDKLNYASSGTGSSAHLGMELFKSLTQTKMEHVPYKGSGPALIDLLGGQVQLLLASAISSAPHLNSGKLRALGVTSGRRSPNLPQLPTIAEAGVPGYDVTGWYGIVAPAGTPPAVVRKLGAELGRAMHAPEVTEKLAADGTEALTGTPGEFRATIAKEIDKWTQLVKTTGLKL
jgi:tripartite-type tricarboxylate transporter receptor subunit TctC